MFLWYLFEFMDFKFNLNSTFLMNDKMLHSAGGKLKIRRKFTMTLSSTGPSIKLRMLYIAWMYEPQKDHLEVKLGKGAAKYCNKDMKEVSFGCVKLQLVEMVPQNQLKASAQMSR